MPELLDRRPWSDTAHEATPPPLPARFYVAGLDLGKYKDWTVLTIMDAFTADVVHVLRFNQLDWNYQEELVRQAVWDWQSPLIIDATAQGGDRILSALQDKINFVPVEGYVFTSISKTALVNQYAIAMQRGETRILHKDAVDAEGRPIGRICLTEIAAYRYDRTNAGTLRMGAPQGKHDDVVSSHMLAYEMARRYAGLGPIQTSAGGDDSRQATQISSPVSSVSPGTPRRQATRMRRRF